MIRPLYQNTAKRPEDLPPTGHAGLWYDKFCNFWSDAWTLKEDRGKEKWIRGVTKEHVGDVDQMNEYARRMVRMIQKSRGYFEVFTTESRFVTGLGRNHPVENGFAWHSTLGTPFLPGSSVKGLVRAWARSKNTPRLDEILGNPSRIGRFCFLDAIPVKPVRLETDVMTPHYAAWGENDPPGDWRSPVPIPFLTTAAGTSFLFGIIPRLPPASGNDADVTNPASSPTRPLDQICDLDQVADWLRSALEWLGGGAKTAVGYGRFILDEHQTLSWAESLAKERARDLTLKSPEGRWRLKIEDKTESHVLEMVRTHLGKVPHLEDPAERQAFARAVESVYPDWVQRWKRGNTFDPSTSMGPKKLKERARSIDDSILSDGQIAAIGSAR